MLISALIFDMKAYLHHMEPFRKRAEGFCVFSLFWGDNRQHMSIHAKMIFSWVRKVLGIARGQMSPSTLQGAAVSAALVAGVFLVSIL